MEKKLVAKRKNNGRDQTETDSNTFAFALRIYNTFSANKEQVE